MKLINSQLHARALSDRQAKDEAPLYQLAVSLGGPYCMLLWITLGQNHVRAGMGVTWGLSLTLRDAL